ncbi:MAG: urease accessory protein UreD [Brachymonas sp.]|nr:urease accessory protein UreD [Brachymonas sp.]
MTQKKHEEKVQAKEQAPVQPVDAGAAHVAAAAHTGLLENVMPEAEFQAFLKTLPESTQWLGNGIPRDCEPWRRAQVLGTEAAEFDRFRDEPPQFRSAGLGKNGFIRFRMALDVDGKRTVMKDLERRAPFLALKARPWDEAMPEMCCMYICSTGGGMLQGDRYSIEITVEEGATAYVSTQSANKIQAMDANYAVQAQTVRVKDNAYLEYMPDLTIPCRHARFLTDTRLEVGDNASVLYGEILVPGRIHHSADEYFGFDVYSACVRAYNKQGQELFCEKFVIDPQQQDLQQLGMMQGFEVYGNVVLLTPKEKADAIFEQIDAKFNMKEELASGVSRLPNDAGLVFKVLGKEVKAVRERIHEFWRVVRKEVKGADLPDPFLWRPY